MKDKFVRSIVCKPTSEDQEVALFKLRNTVAFRDFVVLLDSGYCTKCGYYCSHVIYCLDQIENVDMESKEVMLEHFVNCLN